mgnify:CR=1 FL=1
MNSYIKNYTTPLLKTWSIGSLFVAASLLIVSCGNSVNKEEGEELEEEHVEEVHFSTQQFQSLRMKVDRYWHTSTILT